MSEFYKLETPNNQTEITLGLPYGSVTLKNGQIVPKSSFTETFKDLFKEIPDAKKVPKQEEVKVEEFISQTETKPITEKRKPGRPKKTF